MTDVGSDIFQIGHNHYLVMDDRYSGFPFVAMLTQAITKLKLPPSCPLQTTFGPQEPTWVQAKKITFGPQEPTWIQAKYKLPLGQKSQHGYRSSHTIFGPPKTTKQSKLTLDLNTEQNLMNSVISTHGQEYIRKTQASVKKVRSDKETTCNNCPGVYCVKLPNK